MRSHTISARRLAEARRVADDIRRLVRGLRDSAARVQKESGLSSAQLFVLRQLGEESTLSVKLIGLISRSDLLSAHARRLQELDQASTHLKIWPFSRRPPSSSGG